MIWHVSHLGVVITLSALSHDWHIRAIIPKVQEALCIQVIPLETLQPPICISSDHSEAMRHAEVHSMLLHNHGTQI